MEPEGRILEPKVIRRLEAALRAYFSYSDSTPCSNLYGFIANFIRSLCEQLDIEMLRKATEKQDGKGLEEWRSWYIDEAIQMQARVVGLFSHKIADIETIPALGPSTKVPCDLGYRNAEEFAECWRETVRYRREEKTAVPLSRKNQAKKASHTAPPYLSDAFSVIWPMRKRS